MLQALDGTISAANQARLSAYLDAHPDERVMLEQMLRFEAALVAEPTAAPAHFTANVMAQVQQIAIAQPYAVTAMSGKQIALIVLIFSSALAAAFAVGGGLLAYGSSFVRPDVGPAGAFGRSVWFMVQNFGRAAFSLGRALLTQPITWAAAIAGLLTVMVWLRLVAPAWIPQRQLA